MVQSSVEWLVEQIEHYNLTFGNIPSHKLNQLKKEAKLIEKQQHGDTWDAAIKAHDDRGHVHARSVVDFDDYYNDIYKTQA